MNCDVEQFEARIFHDLKSLLTEGDTLPPRYLEVVACDVFGLTHVGDGNFYADGIKDDVQASVKTRMINPEQLKRIKSGRDFVTHPEKFLGPKQNKKQKKSWAGLEFVQRRQTIDKESGSSARRIGLLTLRGFRQNIAESKRKFSVKKTYEILVIHGYNWRRDRYLVNMYWQELAIPATKNIVWKHDAGGVNGIVVNNGQRQIVMHRVRGGAPREATCFKEYKDPTKYQHSVSISVPIPDKWHLHKEKILNEIQHLKETEHGLLLFTE